MKTLRYLSGIKALGEGAIYAGCRHYYGSAKLLNNEILKYLATRMPEVNGVFIQAENESSAINMVLGSAVAGARVLTTTTTDGLSAMESGFSYLGGMEVPCVIGNIMTGRWGMLNFEPTQSGYVPAVRGGATGSYKFIILAPASVQETYDLTIKAFELADQFRNPVMLLLDSALSQLTEQVEIYDRPLSPEQIPHKPWKINGAKNREPIQYKVYQPDTSQQYAKLFKKYNEIEQITLYEEFMIEDAEEVIIAFGLLAKIIKGIILDVREKGKKIGLFRPISLSPLPDEAIKKIAAQGKKIRVVEANTGSLYTEVTSIIDAIHKNPSFLGESDKLIGYRNIVKALEKELLTT